jgi:hypothetical protein
MKHIATFTIALLVLSNAWAGTFRVHYSLRGSGRDITIQADSSSEARRTVMDMFPGAVVPGVRRINESILFEKYSTHYEAKPRNKNKQNKMNY